MNEEKLKIAVFIDFDNIQIGVRSTLSRDFDLALVLEALKERGEVVTKIAYGNWKRAGELTRTLTQNAVLMVQRDLTPRGDKNGADINLALDALEMAINHPHINAFVVVGGDSDFIALVEKLKQYNKAVFVVGGRSFTSSVLQRNCREFIAYENLIEATSTPAERRRDEGVRRREVYPLQRAVPLVYRGLKVLADREVQAQLGLLKSTLIQLDSTFNERDYAASSFRGFIQKLADAHLCQVRQQGNSYVVEPLEREPFVAGADAEHSEEEAGGAEGNGSGMGAAGREREHPGEQEGEHEGEIIRQMPIAAMPFSNGELTESFVPRNQAASPYYQPARFQDRPERTERTSERAQERPQERAPERHLEPAGEGATAPAPLPQLPPEEALELLQRILAPLRGTNPRPLYLRNVKQLLRAESPNFDEQQHGFASIVDLLRAGQSQNWLRLQRDRRGALRVFVPMAPGSGPAEEENNGGKAHTPEPHAEVDGNAVAGSGVHGVEGDEERQPNFDQGDFVAAVPAAAPVAPSRPDPEDSQIAVLGYYDGIHGERQPEDQLSLAAAVADTGRKKRAPRKPKAEGASAPVRRRKPPRK